MTLSNLHPVFGDILQYIAPRPIAGVNLAWRKAMSSHELPSICPKCTGEITVTIEYGFQPEQKESWGYHGGTEPIAAHVEDVRAEDTTCEWCGYVLSEADRLERGNTFADNAASILDWR